VLYSLDCEFRKQSLTPDTDKENRPPLGVENENENKKRKRTQKKKRPETATKQKKKREEASVIERHPAPTLQVSLL